MMIRAFDKKYRKGLCFDMLQLFFSRQGGLNRVAWRSYDDPAICADKSRQGGVTEAEGGAVMETRRGFAGRPATYFI